MAAARKWVDSLKITPHKRYLVWFNILSVLAKNHGYTFYRWEFNQILEVVQHYSSSCTSSSSEEDDLDLLLIENRHSETAYA